MTNYAQIARNNWQTLAPSTLKQMGEEMDLDQHFKDLGDRAEQLVIDLANQYAGPDQAQETYMQKVGRLNAATSRAQEYVIAEELTPPMDVWENQESPEEEQLQEQQFEQEMRIQMGATDSQLALMSPQEREDTLYRWESYLQQRAEEKKAALLTDED